MKITSAIVDIENEIIVLRSELGEHFEFNPSKELPQWVSEEMKELEYITRLGNCMYFIRIFDKNKEE